MRGVNCQVRFSENAFWGGGRRAERSGSGAEARAERCGQRTFPARAPRADPVRLLHSKSIFSVLRFSFGLVPEWRREVCGPVSPRLDVRTGSRPAPAPIRAGEKFSAHGRPVYLPPPAAATERSERAERKSVY